MHRGQVQHRHRVESTSSQVATTTTASLARTTRATHSVIRPIRWTAGGH